MKKFINNPEYILNESLQGFAASHADIVRLELDPHFVYRALAGKQSQVAVISGGGSGHEPLHIGFVGRGMLAAACPGQIFTSPTPAQMLAAASKVENGAGVLFVVKNYAGDVMNFEMAAEMLDVACETVLVADDVALPKTHSTGRRGVAGALIVEKIIGAAAQSGVDLATCKILGDKVSAATASVGVALHSCTVPALGEVSFALDAGQMEIGVGIHGERGCDTADLATADAIVARLLDSLCADLAPKSGQKILLHINGLGATPLLELYLVYNAAAAMLASQNIAVHRSLVGNYTTSLDMTGCSITITLLDDEMIRYWDAPVHTANLRWGC